MHVKLESVLASAYTQLQLGHVLVLSIYLLLGTYRAHIIGMVNGILISLTASHGGNLEGKKERKKEVYPSLDRVWTRTRSRIGE